MAHVQNIDEVVFFRKCRRLIKIMKVEVLNPIVRALVHFWDPDYRYFSFKKINLCLTMEEYGMLIEFPDHLYKVYFP
jgi:arginyl-tRNA--protein-N-Asp/Glu arginylyltransferase